MVSQTEQAFNIDAEGRRRRKDRPEPEKKSIHPLETIPPFQRPVGASTDDVEIPTSDPGVRAFKTKLGKTYTISIDDSTYEAEREKRRDDIINSIESIKGYLKDPSLPSKEQVVDFVKSAALGTLENIDKMMKGGATYGDIFGAVAGIGAASTPFKVPEGSLRAGFTGTNPPTYEPRIDLDKYFEEFNVKPGTRKAEVIKEALSDPEISARFKPKLTADEIFFRKPIMQFIRSLDVPKKGILGSNFSKLIKENPSISPTSLQEQLITPTKRYSKEELEDIFKSGEFSTAALPDRQKIKNLGGRVTQRYENYQRQKQVGFRGGEEKEYFEIPIKSFTPKDNIQYKSKAFRKLEEERKKDSSELLGFRPKKDTHFGDSTIAHLRGSIVQPKATTFSLPEFDKIIKSRPFLLIEELQSNLVQGGFLKSNFDEIYDEAIYRFNDASFNNYDRVFRTTDGDFDKKLRDLIQEIDKENPALPNSFIYKYGLEFGVKGEKLIDEDGGILDRKEALSPFEFEDYLRNKLKSKGLEEIPRRNFEDFFAKYRQSISGRTYYQKTGKERQALQEYGSPPITKNKQAVEELIKVAIGKAANEGVNYIVIPNVTRIKIAREGKFNPKDKSDLFYRTYFKDLNSALADLEKNYPVEIYNVNLPYDDKAFLSSMGALSSDVPNLYLDTFREFVESNSPKLTNEVLDSSGTIIDITDLVKKFKVEEPRQFAEGGDIMKEQMQMAFMNEGGLKDDGMDKDPVSGNEVPSGSMAEEVRDNIPAQLSEGEYVVPADVVRYYGVKFFEDLRDQAKMGLADMEANGRIGGEPVPAGGPINDEELSPQEMQAIREVMGMAEGGDIQNPYMQQQLLYSQPRPAPIDDQKNTVVGITNPAQNQMPVQNMAAGGQIQGYQTGGLEQSFLDAGQSAVNRGFVGFPLGSTIFPSEKTGQTVLGSTGTQVATTGAIDTAIKNTGTTGTDTSTLTTVTLYGPNGEIVVLTLPTDQARYDQLISEGYTTTPPVENAPVVKTRGTRDRGDKPDINPNSWMKKFDYTGDLKTNNLAQQTSDELKKAPVGGVIGAFINGSNAAQAAANIIILENNGGDPTKIAELKNQYKQFIKDTNLSFLPKGLINGDALAKDIVRNNIDIALNRKSVDINGEPIFKDDDEFNKLMQEVAPEGMTFDPTEDRTIAALGKGDTPTTVKGVYKRKTPVSKTLVSSPRPVARPPTKPQPAAKATEDMIEKQREAAREEARKAAAERRKDKRRAMRDARRGTGGFAKRKQKTGVGGRNIGGRNKGGLMTKGK